MVERPGQGVPVVLAIGSNLGDRAATLAAARGRLEERGILAIEEESPVLETDAMGPPQPKYLNQVVRGRSALAPLALLAEIHRLEADLGRRRDTHWGPRTIDIDILDYDGQIIDHPELRVPHPEIPHREFVLRPWSAIDPDFVPPGLDRSVTELLENCR